MSDSISLFLDYLSTVLLVITILFQILSVLKKAKLPVSLVVSVSVIVAVGLVLQTSSLVTIGYSLYVLTPRPE